MRKIPASFSKNIEHAIEKSTSSTEPNIIIHYENPILYQNVPLNNTSVKFDPYFKKPPKQFKQTQQQKSMLYSNKNANNSKNNQLYTATIKEQPNNLKQKILQKASAIVHPSHIQEQSQIPKSTSQESKEKKPETEFTIWRGIHLIYISLKQERLKIEIENRHDDKEIYRNEFTNETLPEKVKKSNLHVSTTYYMMYANQNQINFDEEGRIQFKQIFDSQEMRKLSLPMKRTVLTQLEMLKRQNERLEQENKRVKDALERMRQKYEKVFKYDKILLDKLRKSQAQNKQLQKEIENLKMNGSKRTENGLTKNESASKSSSFANGYQNDWAIKKSEWQYSPNYNSSKYSTKDDYLKEEMQSYDMYRNPNQSSRYQQNYNEYGHYYRNDQSANQYSNYGTNHLQPTTDHPSKYQNLQHQTSGKKNVIDLQSSDDEDKVLPFDSTYHHNSFSYPHESLSAYGLSKKEQLQKKKQEKLLIEPPDNYRSSMAKLESLIYNQQNQPKIPHPIKEEDSKTKTANPSKKGPKSKQERQSMSVHQMLLNSSKRHINENSDEDYLPIRQNSFSNNIKKQRAPRKSKAQIDDKVKIWSEYFEERNIPQMVDLISPVTKKTGAQFKELTQCKLGLDTMLFVQIFGGLTHLDLSWNKIRTIEGFASLVKLKVMNLSKNDIRKIPNLEILKSLEQLNLSNNEIDKIEGVFELKKLTILSLQSNNIGELPHMISQNTSLKELYLSDNHIRTIPESINELKHLKVLMINDNLISIEKTDEGRETRKLFDNLIYENKSLQLFIQSQFTRYASETPLPRGLNPMSKDLSYMNIKRKNSHPQKLSGR